MPEYQVNAYVQLAVAEKSQGCSGQEVLQRSNIAVDLYLIGCAAAPQEQQQIGCGGRHRGVGLADSSGQVTGAFSGADSPLVAVAGTQGDGLSRAAEVPETWEYLVEKFINPIDCECLFYGLVASHRVDGIPAVHGGFLGHPAPDEAHGVVAPPCPCRPIRVKALEGGSGQIHTAAKPGQQVIAVGAVGFIPGLGPGERTAGDHPPEHVNDADVPHQVSDLPSGTAWHYAVESALGTSGDPLSVAAQGNHVISRFHCRRPCSNLPLYALV
jgi:hypothetical protein